MGYRVILIGGHSPKTEIERFETLNDALAFIDDANSDFASQYSSSDDYHNDRSNRYSK